jgi:ribosomal protein L9
MSIRDQIATADTPRLVAALEDVLALVEEADHGRQSYGSLYGKVTTHQIVEAINEALDAA